MTVERGEIEVEEFPARFGVPVGGGEFHLIAWPQREHRQKFERAQETLKAGGPRDFAPGSIGVAKFLVT